MRVHTLPGALSCLLLATLVLRSAAKQEHSDSGESTKETTTIKNKLATAEGRVSDLISRLDSVSTEATHAKSEIHNTLLEVWNVVDLLGKDQCGTVVEKARVAQTKAESKVSELQDEIRVLTQDIETLKVQLAKRDDTITSVRIELKAERSRRETIENEARELRDKLHWANAVSNETEKYAQVAERLQKLLVIVTERTTLLSRISNMVSDAHEGFADWQTEVKSLATIVRQSERRFSGSYKGDAVDSFGRQIGDLQQRLKTALSSKSDLVRERDTLRGKLSTSEERTAQRNVEYASTLTREPIIRRYDVTGGGGGVSGASGSWMGILTFIVLSLGTGMVGTVMLSFWRDKDGGRGGGPVGMMGPGMAGTPDDRAKFGFASSSPGQGRHSPQPPGRASMSPLTYVDQGNSSKNSTPRRY